PHPRATGEASTIDRGSGMIEVTFAGQETAIAREFVRLRSPSSCLPGTQRSHFRAGTEPWPTEIHSIAEVILRRPARASVNREREPIRRAPVRSPGTATWARTTKAGTGTTTRP